MSTIAHRPATGLELIREQTVGSLLRWATEQAPDTRALVEGVPEPADRRTWTYSELLTESERAARALLGRFAPGERIASGPTTSPNGWCWRWRRRWPD
jgi:fatty-acyl-CoA synthase